MRYTAFILSRVPRRTLILATQAALAAIAWAVAFMLGRDMHWSAIASPFVETVPYLLVVRLLTARFFQLDSGYWQHVGTRDLMRLAMSVTVGTVGLGLVLAVLGRLAEVGATVMVLDWMLAIGLNGAARLGVRMAHEYWAGGRAPRARRAFIIGAGETGEQILRQLQHDPRQRIQVVGLLDDDPAKVGRMLHGVRILGTAADLRHLAARHRADLALVAVPSATTGQLRSVVNHCLDAGVQVKALPLLKDLVTEDVRLTHFRDVPIEDLLGREAISLDLSGIRPALLGKVVLITGAGGSIGSELARQAAQFHPLQLVLVDRAESPLYFVTLELAKAHPEIQIVPILASITNAERMRHVFEHHRPDCVLHAAAYKQVPMLETSVAEAVWNNVFGTLRIARCAARVHTKQVVLISTDKAVNPQSVLGMTKLIAERLVLELPSLVASSTDFRVVRFGNVLGSEGSVIPFFKRQLADGGPLTVTHPDVRRYFMTISEAAQLVLRAMILPEAAGRVALLEMGDEVRIVDLAEQLIRLAGLIPHQDVAIVFTGLRPGEKLSEDLVAEGEVASPTSVDKIRVLERTRMPGDGLARRVRALASAAARRDEVNLSRVLATFAAEYGPAGLNRPREGHESRAVTEPRGNGTYGRT